MLLDRFRKKTKRPTGNGDSPLETIDIASQVPQIDDVLAEIDKALQKAELLENQTQPRKSCGC